MKIAVTGGNEYTEFLAGILTADGNKVTVIDKDKDFCRRICSAWEVNAVHGDPCQERVLEDSGIRQFDVMIALGQEDADNFEICQMGKKVFGVRKAVCLVRNPRNVDLFKTLGIDRVVNVPEMIAGMVK